MRKDQARRAESNGTKAAAAPQAAATSIATPGMAESGNDTAANSQSSETSTERGWDGWPTSPTPDYLIPRMGKIPVSSAIHFQTVAMNSLKDAPITPEGLWKAFGARTQQVLRNKSLGEASGPILQSYRVVVTVLSGTAKGQVFTGHFDVNPAGLTGSGKEHLGPGSISNFRLSAFGSEFVVDRPAEADVENGRLVKLFAGGNAPVPGGSRSFGFNQGFTPIHVLPASPEGRWFGYLDTLTIVDGFASYELEPLGQVMPSTGNPNAGNAAPDTVFAQFFKRVASVGELAGRLSGRGVTAADFDDASMTTLEDYLTQQWNKQHGIFDGGQLDPLLVDPGLQDEPIEGVILYHEQAWFARGLALGNLLHSVALAPGEVTQIAMTHWNHTTRSTDSEEVSQADSAIESDTQNRSVQEVQSSAMQEHASGGSSASSASESASSGTSSTELSGSVGFFSSKAGITGTSSSSGSSHTVSSVVTRSDGSRDLSMQANQNVAATTQRHAEAARTRRATVVREVSQSEAQELTTRVLANYNHMHALTVMYFEVIEVYDLKTRVIDAERVIFLPFAAKEIFELIPRFRAVLVDAAISMGKRSLAEAIRYCVVDRELAKVSGLSFKPIGDHDADLGLDIQHLRLAKKIATLQSRRDEANRKIKGDKANGVPGILGEIAALGNDAHLIDLQAALTKAEGERQATLASYQSITLPANDPFGFGQLLSSGMRSRLNQELAQANTQIQAAQSALANHRSFLNSRRKQLLAEKDEQQRVVNACETNLEMYYEAQRLVAMLEDDKLRTTGPFASNRLYFNQAVWLHLAPSDVLALARRRYNGELLSSNLDPAPVAVTGNYVGYRWRFADPVQSQRFKREFVEPFTNDPDEQLRTVSSTIAVPTGGVFGEAVLGEAVSAEKIDLSRFWNWKDSPIPILPTGINPLTAATPTVQNLSAEPMKLDESSAKLSQLQDLPAPSGFSALAQTMQAQIFRDMSGQGLLQHLAEATTKAASESEGRAAEIASSNLKAGLEFVKDMVNMAVQAAAASETGGASTAVSGLLSSKNGGSASVVGGVMNAKEGALEKLAGTGAGGQLGESGGAGDGPIPSDSGIPVDELEEVDAKPSGANES